MPGFTHILYPIDFSERSKAIRPFVELMTHQFKAKLTLMNVLGMPPGVVDDVDPSFPVMFDYPALETQVRKSLENYLEPGFTASHNVEIEVLRGDAASMIADYARRSQVDLIMMSTHGYGRFRSLLLGSVVSKVLHDVDGAVWTAPHSEDPALLDHLACRSMLVATNLNPEQVDVIRQAAELAREFGATLRLVHAVPAAAHHPADTGGEEFALFLLRTARDEMAKLQRKAGTDLEAYVEAGPVSEVVRSAALEHRADLLVIGRGVMHDTFGRLRTQSYGIIRASPCPVLSL